jgi:hypothetical protein
MVQMRNCLRRKILLLKRMEMNEVGKVEYQIPGSKSRCMVRICGIIS